MAAQTALRPDATGERPTTSLETAKQYAAAVRTLRLHFARETGTSAHDITPGALALWFKDQHDRWSTSTLRQYRRGVETYILAKSRDCEKERNRLLALIAETPAPRKSGPKRTSAKKAKFITNAETRMLEVSLRNEPGRDAEILSLLCSLGPVFGLRPIEWLSARIVDNWLVIKNAKASNGRGNGVERAVSLVALQASARTSLERLCMLMRAALSEAECWKKLEQRLGSRLARICRSLGLRRLCLYALRGAAVARLKAAGLAPRAIAALLGHRSSNTAFRHYPHARHSKGWRVYIAITPHPHSMSRVRDSYQPFEAKLLQRSGSLRVRLNAEHCAAEHRIMGNASNGNDYPLADINGPEGMQGEASPEAPECGEGMLDGNRNSCLGC